MDSSDSTFMYIKTNRTASSSDPTVAHRQPGGISSQVSARTGARSVMVRPWAADAATSVLLHAEILGNEKRDVRISCSKISWY